MTQKPKIEEAFGIIVRQRRKLLGISQERFAELADLHRTYVSQIERGKKSPSLRALFNIAKALGETPHTLLEEMEKRLDATK
jgi:transcriptional regulator with XRE-family HTH domain